MEERAPGGEIVRRPLEWLEYFSRLGEPCEGQLERCFAMRQEAMTRYEFFEECAFTRKGQCPCGWKPEVPKEEQDGSV